MTIIVLQNVYSFQGESITILEIGAGPGTNFQYYDRPATVHSIEPNLHFDGYFKDNRWLCNSISFWQGQARGIWTYHSLKFEIWSYHEGPTLQGRRTQKWLESSLNFFHILKIRDICGHLQLF